MRFVLPTLLSLVLVSPDAAAQVVVQEIAAPAQPAGQDPQGKSGERRQWHLRASVVDENGAPIPGAGLIRGTADHADVSRLLQRPDVNADAKGQIDWSFESAPQERFVSRYVLIGAKGRAFWWTQLRYNSAVGTSDLGQVVLPKGTTITGLVRDEAGQPVAGARVAARDVLAANHLKIRTASTDTDHYASFATSDAKGIFRLRGLLRIGASVTVRAPGHHLARVNFVNRFQPLVVQLHKGGFVSGKVVDANGQPVQCMLKIGYEMSEAARSSERTADDGTFRINLDYPGRYRVGAMPRTSGASGGWQYGEVVTGSREGLEIKLRAAATGANAGGAVAVTVVDKATGEKIAKCRGVAGWVQDRIFQIRTDHLKAMLRSSGQAASAPGQLLLPGPRAGQPHTGRIRVQSPGYASVEIAEVAWEDDQKNQYRVEMVAESSLSGMVVDAKTGEPIKGAVVQVSKKKTVKRAAGVFAVATTTVGSRPSPTGPRTDAEGKFRIGELGAGKYELRISHRKRPDAKPQTVTVAAAEHKAGIAFEMAQGVTLRGKLTGGEIGQGWRMRLRKVDRRTQFVLQLSSSGRPNTTWPHEVSVAADGSFTVGDLHNASYQLQLLIPTGGNPHEMSGLALKSVRVRDEDLDKEIDISRKLPGRLTGKVRWSGAALPPGRLLLVAEAKPKNRNNVSFLGAFGLGTLRGPKAVAQPDGSFSIAVPPGSYRLIAMDLATGVRLHVTEDWRRVDAREAVKLDPQIALALVRLHLEPDQGEVVVASRLQFRIADPQQQDNPLFAQLRNAQFDQGDGLLLRPGQRDLELFLPLREVKIFVRSAAYNLREGMHRHNTPPVGEVEFTPEAGKASRMTVKVEIPDLAKMKAVNPATGQVLIRGK